MSAIAKPLTHFTTGAFNTANQNIFIPVEQVIQAEALNVDFPSGGGTDEFYILFTLANSVHQPKVRFTSLATRDTALAAFKTAFSTATA